MKKIISILFVATLISCNKQTNQNQALQKRVDSLEKKVAESYKPGFGDFMGGIQVHHNKLWLQAKMKTGNWLTLKFMKSWKRSIILKNIRRIERKAK